MRGSNYTIIFATSMSMILSVVLSSVYMLLKERQDDNRAFEQQRSILAAAHINIESDQEARRIYRERVKALVINNKGEVIDAEQNSVNDKTPDLALLFAIYEPGDLKQPSAYVYPVVGSGLWSKLLGYLAVDKSGRQILGLTFYKQGETPGLGAEIEKPWFTNNFSGKSLFDQEKLVGVKVAKGAASRDPSYKYAKNRLVDGISGATITGDGVSAMLASAPKRYQAFFKRVNL